MQKLLPAPSGTMTRLTNEALIQTLTAARNEEKANRAIVFAFRLKRLAIHIRNQALNTTECAELLDEEAERIENEVRNG